MYCPKCGKDNPDDAKFCRSCGKDVAGISGKKPASHAISKKKKGDSWDSAMGSLFTGIAFLVITGVLAFQPMGRGWWFWMFIPAFAMIGKGIAKIIRLEKDVGTNNVEFSAGTRKQMEAQDQPALPPKQMSFASEFDEPHYDAERVTPSSVTEETTRHLDSKPKGKTTKLNKE